MLSNSGEQLILQDPAENIIADFEYNNSWYPATDGEGFSPVVIDTTANNNLSDPANWKPSNNFGGSPGTAETGTTVLPGSIVINEILAHSHGEASEWIELHNITNQPIISRP